MARDRSKLVPAPLKSASVTTPGCHLLEVKDLDTGLILTDVTSVDCDAGIAWRMTVPGGRSHPHAGRYQLLCSPEDLRLMERLWNRLQ